MLFLLRFSLLVRRVATSNNALLWALRHYTSGEASSLREALEPEVDLSEVLLALDLMEVLLELFLVPDEAFWPGMLAVSGLSSGWPWWDPAFIVHMYIKMFKRMMLERDINFNFYMAYLRRSTNFILDRVLCSRDRFKWSFAGLGFEGRYAICSVFGSLLGFAFRLS